MNFLEEAKRLFAEARTRRGTDEHRELIREARVAALIAAADNPPEVVHWRLEERSSWE